ncbi:MAG: phosphoribosyltransferase family protein [Pyrodictiaceae archaeon]
MTATSEEGSRKSKYEALKIRIMASEALRLAKKLYSYRQLSEMIGLPESVIAKYVTGHTVPSLEQATRILERLEKAINPRRIIASRLSELGGLIDLSPVLTDPLLLRIVSLYFYRRFQGDGVTRILVPEASGISLATALAIIFEVPMAIARRSKHNPYEEYIEGAYVEPPNSYLVFYVPRNSISRRDRILIVDDIVQSGRTLYVMKRIVEKVGARIVGVAALVAIGEEWVKRGGIKRVEAIVHIHKAS